MTEEQPKRAYEMQLQRAKEMNDITFMMKDVELRKWCVDRVMVLPVENVIQTSKLVYDFITGYERAPEPQVQEPESVSDVPDDIRN